MPAFEKGFTLVELLVVVAILGILAAVGLISYNGYLASTKKASARNIAQQMSLAQTEYLTDEGEYFESDGACSRDGIPTSMQSNQINTFLLKTKTITSEIGYNFCVYLGSPVADPDADTDVTEPADYTIVSGISGCIGTYDSYMQWGGCFEGE